MIIDLTLGDNTQTKIMEHLKQTEKLISKVATKLSNGKRECNIYAMPDLGIASNITRMCGGMYTGSCYTWETDEPFIPVDSTVNVCGTAVFKLKEEILSIPHYGMPNINSVCIGTQWNNRLYTLLTAPGNNIYLVKPIVMKGSANSFIHNDTDMLLTPHGLGVKLVNDDVNITYVEQGMMIGDKKFSLGESVNIDVDVKIRTHNEKREVLDNTINKVLKRCPGEIQGELEQICSITKRGFKIY